MKSIKKEFIILGVIIVILLGYLLMQNKDKVHYKVPALETIEKENIDKVEIKKKDQTISLVKKDSQWLIQSHGYPTDAKKLDTIINTIIQLTLTDLVSKSKNYTLYDLTEEKAIHVTAYSQNKELRDFEIGKMASTYGHTFVKIKDNPNVYLARESFRNQFDTEVNDLRDKNVMKLDKNEITEIEIQKEGKSFVFTKNVKPTEPPVIDIKKAGDQKTEEKKADEKKPGEIAPPKPEDRIAWLMPDGKKGQKSQLDSLITQLTNLSCKYYVEDKTIEDFKNQTPIYTLKLKGSKDYVLTIYPKPETKEGEETPEGGEKYPVISSENPYPFLLSTYRADQIMKKPEELIEEEKNKK